MVPAMDAVRSMAREARRDQAASVYAGAAGARQQTGDQAVSLSKAEQILQEAESFQRLDFLSVQRVDGKTFHLDPEDGIWKDNDLKPEQRIRTVEIGSAEFERLLDSHAELGRYAALGSRVQVVLDGQAWLIELNEVPPWG